MIEKSVLVTNKLGIHARPAALLTKTANLFECSIKIKKNNKTIDAKSILHVMTLAAKKDDLLVITCEGTNELAAAEAIESLFQSGFGEE